MRDRTPTVNPNGSLLENATPKSGEMDRKRIGNGPEMDRKWTGNEPEMNRKWTGNEPEMNRK